MKDRSETSIITESGGHIVPACPPWCVLPGGHDLDDMDRRDFDGAVNRMHKAREWTIPTRAASATMCVEVVQTLVVGRPGDEPDETPSVLVAASAVCLTLAQARAAADALTAAADALEAIERHTSGDAS